MSRTVTICDDGQCGQCPHCRLNRVKTEFEVLREAVRYMRKAQKLYFLTRSPSVLREAQSQERWVDAMLDRSIEEQQPRLF